MQYISIEVCDQIAPAGLTYVGKQSRNAQSKGNALMLPPSRLNPIYPLKSTASLLLVPLWGNSLCAAAGQVRETVPIRAVKTTLKRASELLLMVAGD